MKVKPEYELESLLTLKDELYNCLDELTSAIFRSSLLDCIDDDSLTEAYKLIAKRLENVNNEIRKRED